METARKAISPKVGALRFVVAFHHCNFATNVNTFLIKVDINTANVYCGDDLLFSNSFEKVKRDRL